MTTKRIGSSDLHKFAYSIPEAAEGAGVSVASIRRGIDDGHLAVHYPPPLNKPVILLTDLIRWVENAPTERP